MANFPTLSLAPDYPLDPDGSIGDVVLRSEMAGGYEITRPRTTRTRREWGVRYQALTGSDVSTLKTFEAVTLKNGADSFTWTHPVSGTGYTVRLAGPISYANTSYDLFSVSFQLRQV